MPAGWLDPPPGGGGVGWVRLKKFPGANAASATEDCMGRWHEGEGTGMASGHADAGPKWSEHRHGTGALEGFGADLEDPPGGSRSGFSAGWKKAAGVPRAGTTPDLGLNRGAKKY